MIQQEHNGSGKWFSSTQEHKSTEKSTKLTPTALMENFMLTKLHFGYVSCKWHSIKKKSDKSFDKLIFHRKVFACPLLHISFFVSKEKEDHQSKFFLGFGKRHSHERATKKQTRSVLKEDWVWKSLGFFRFLTHNIACN